MLRVLLVDDEPFIVQGLKVLIDWDGEGYEIAASAADGREALEYLKENKVDLIISDIKMPEMSGIELLETIREQKISDAYFVILSGYSDFSLAQQAIRYKCMDYVLKPVEKDELLSVIRRVASLSENDKRERQNQKKMERAYLGRNIAALMLGKYDEKNLEYITQHMQLSEGVRYIEIEYVEDLVEREDGAAKQLQRDIYEACQDILEEDGTHALYDVSNEKDNYDTGFIFCDYMAAKAECCEEEYLMEFHEKLERILQRPVHLLVGKKVPNITAISKSYTTTCILKSLVAFYERKDMYFYEKEVHVNEGGMVLCKNSLDSLIGAIEQNEKIEIRKCVDSLYEDIRKSGGGGDVVNLNINYLLFQLIHLATEQDEEVNQEEVLQFISESSFEDGVKRGSSTHLARFCHEYADYLAQLRKDASRGILAEIEKEVREHYAENLSLRDLSEKYYLNSSYLGQIFRKKYGQSFKDYLTNYRISEATKLLIKTDKKIGQIAEEVGYKDSDYFIRKFIEIKGCTPSKYRKNKMNME